MYLLCMLGAGAHAGSKANLPHLGGSNGGNNPFDIQFNIAGGPGSHSPAQGHSCPVLLHFCINHKGNACYLMQFCILPAAAVKQVTISRAQFAADSCSLCTLFLCSRCINASTRVECT